MVAEGSTGDAVCRRPRHCVEVRGLVSIMTIFVEVLREVALTVSRRKTETLLIRVK